MELEGLNSSRNASPNAKNEDGSDKDSPGDGGFVEISIARLPGLDGLGNKLVRSDSWGGTITRQWHRLSPVDHSLKFAEADGVSLANQTLRLVARHTPLPRIKDRSGCYQKQTHWIPASQWELGPFQGSCTLVIHTVDIVTTTATLPRLDRQPATSLRLGLLRDACMHAT